MTAFVALLGLSPLAAHGHGVEGATPWMWAIWAFAFVVSAWSIWAALKTTFRPGETEPDHVKRSILEEDRGPGASPAGRFPTDPAVLGGGSRP